MRHEPSTFLSFLRKIAEVLWVLRAPFIFSLICLAIFSTPPQIIEMYVYLAQDAKGQWLQIVFALATLAALGLTLYVVARDLTLADELEIRGHLTQKSTQGFLLRAAPGGFSLIPFIGVIIGMIWARDRFNDYCDLEKDLNTVANSLGSLTGTGDKDIMSAVSESCGLATRMDAAILVSGAVALAIFFIALRTATVNIEKFDVEPRSIFSRRVWRWFAIFSIALIIVFTAQNFVAGRSGLPDFTQLPRFLGVLVVINLFLLCMVYLISRFTWFNQRFGLPILIPFVAAAVIFSWFNLNDNHAARLIKSEDRAAMRGKVAIEKKSRSLRLGRRADGSATAQEEDPLGRPFMADAFIAWLQARAGYIDRYLQKPDRLYPVYIVAAEGGGLYATELAALTLARLYDRCPDLQNHIFAISGVSGGSVGAGMLASLLIQEQEKLANATGCDLLPAQSLGLEDKVQAFLSQDFLSPVAASGLFPDVFQRFIPGTWGGIFDRARAFEASIERGFARAVNTGKVPNPLAGPYLSHWSPDGPAPMLVLNTTSVETGKQAIIAPYRLPGQQGTIKGLPESRLIHDHLARLKADIPLSTALSLSARFPLVMPAGLFEGYYVEKVDQGGGKESERRGKYQFRLVDGGYFENSGATTARAIIKALRLSAAKPSASTCLWQPASRTCSDPKDDAASPVKIDLRLIVLGEKFTAPIKPEGLNELLSPIRTLLRTRSERGTQAIADAFEIAPDRIEIQINHDRFNMPLGWQFSPQTQRLIAAQIGKPDECLDEDSRLERDATLQNNVDAKLITVDMADFFRSLQGNPCYLKQILDAAKDGVPVPQLQPQTTYEQLESMVPTQ